MPPDKAENSALLLELVQPPENMQVFADLASPEANWQSMNTKISLPRNAGFAVEECPACLEAIRLIFDKFAGVDLELPLTCPHCKAALACISEFTGYTNEITLDEVIEANPV